MKAIRHEVVIVLVNTLKANDNDIDVKLSVLISSTI